MENSAEFGNLLKHYRYRTINPDTQKRLTQEQCIDRLANEFEMGGYTTQNWGYWERGTRRIPDSNRKLLIAIISLLCQYGSISKLDEAETLLSAAHYRELNADEIQQINPGWLNQAKPTTVENTPAKAWQIRVTQFVFEIIELLGKLPTLNNLGWLLLLVYLYWSVQPLFKNEPLSIISTLWFALAMLLTPLGVTVLTGIEAGSTQLTKPFLSRAMYAKIGFITLTFPLVCLSFFVTFWADRTFPQWGIIIMLVGIIAFSHSQIVYSNNHQPLELGWVLGVLLVPLNTACLYLFHFQLAEFIYHPSLIMMIVIYIVAVLVGAEKRKRPESISDVIVILLIGIVCPLALISTSFVMVIQTTPESNIFDVIADGRFWLITTYFLAFITLGVTIWLRQFTRIMVGAPVYFLPMAYGLEPVETHFGFYGVLVLVAVFLLGWLRLRRNHRFSCKIHLSALCLLIIMIGSLWFQNQFPLWVVGNTVVFAVFASFIIVYTYRHPAPASELTNGSTEFKF